MARLSVVVPFFNVEDYLAAALESIARQTLSDFEVILVDDASTDGSRLIAEDYAARDRRFRVVRQDNPGAGPGPCRNTGISQATGEYLTFADGDDVVAPHAYALLTGSLEKTGSDFATGAFRRLTATGTRPVRMVDGVFQQTVLRTHVSRMPILIRDLTPWNKVYRRSFWDSRGLVFPPGLYEDGPVAVRAHVQASTVDVLADVIYYWRIRDAGARSITGGFRDIANIEHRMTAVRDAGSFLAANAPALKRSYDVTVLRSDIRMLVQAFEQAGDAQRERIAELAAGYLQTVDSSVYADVPMADRLRGFLLGQRKLPELLELLRFERSGEARTAPLRRGDSDGGGARSFAAYPFFGDPAHGIPASLYDVTSEMTLTARVDSARWQGRSLRIGGYAYIHRVSSATASECQLQISLRNSRTGRTIQLPVSRIPRPDITAGSGQAAVSYDWSGFTVQVTPRMLGGAPARWTDADWELRAEVAGGGLRLAGPVSSAQPGTAQRLPGRWAGRGVWLQPGMKQGGQFTLRVQQVAARVTACAQGDGTLDIEGWSSQPLASGAALLISPRRGGRAAVRVAVEPVRGRGWAELFSRRPGRPLRAHPFRARIPAHALTSHETPIGLIDPNVHVHDEFSWDVTLSPGDGTPAVRLSIDPATAGAGVAEAGREVIAHAGAFAVLSLLERTTRPVVTGLDWAGDGRLVLRGSYRGERDRPAALVLWHAKSGDRLTLPLQWEGSTFTAGTAGSGPLASGNWKMLVPAGAGGAGTAVALHQRLAPSLSGYHRVGPHEVAARTYNNDALLLHVRPAAPGGGPLTAAPPGVLSPSRRPIPPTCGAWRARREYRQPLRPARSASAYGRAIPACR